MRLKGRLALITGASRGLGAATAVAFATPPLRLAAWVDDDFTLDESGVRLVGRLTRRRWSLGDRVLAFTPGHLVHGEDVAQLQQRLLELGLQLLGNGAPVSPAVFTIALPAE